jgi:hypothetical protein
MSKPLEAPTNLTSPKTLIWKAEVEFQGNPEEFLKLAEALSAARAKIDFGKIKPGPGNGYVAPRFLDVSHRLAGLNETNSQRIAGPINGGIRTPHFHLGKEIVLVDRTQFKNILGEVARDVFEQRALQKDDYLDVIAPFMETEG